MCKRRVFDPDLAQWEDFDPCVKTPALKPASQGGFSADLWSNPFTHAEQNGTESQRCVGKLKFGFEPRIILGWIILNWIILSWIILSWIILSWIILSWIILGWIILSYIILSWIILSWIILSWIILSWIILRWIIMSWIILNWIILDTCRNVDWPSQTGVTWPQTWALPAFWLWRISSTWDALWNLQQLLLAQAKHSLWKTWEICQITKHPLGLQPPEMCRGTFHHYCCKKIFFSRIGFVLSPGSCCFWGLGLTFYFRLMNNLAAFGSVVWNGMVWYGLVSSVLTIYGELWPQS